MRIAESVENEGQSVRFALEGDFELTDVATLERRVADRRRGDRVTVDARGLRFLDSSALALLLRLQRLADEDGWSLTFIPGDALRARARRTGLDTLLDFVEEPAPTGDGSDARPGPAPRTSSPG